MPINENEKIIVKATDLTLSAVLSKINQENTKTFSEWGTFFALQNRTLLEMILAYFFFFPDEAIEYLHKIKELTPPDNSEEISGQE